MKLFLPVFLSILAVSHSSSLFGQAKTFLELVTKLKYKDSCSYADEVVRTNWTGRVAEMTPSAFGYTQLVTGFMNDVISKNKNLCAATELVICDKETEKCKCGDPGKVALLPDSPDNYVEEVDDYGVLRCRWGKGSSCVSDDIFQAQGIGAYVNSKCRRGTRCAATHDASDCSFLTLIRYIRVNYGYGKTASVAQITKDLLGGKICTCESESSEKNPSREKRSTREYKIQNVETLHSLGAAFGIVQDLFVQN